MRNWQSISKDTTMYNSYQILDRIMINPIHWPYSHSSKISRLAKKPLIWRINLKPGLPEFPSLETQTTLAMPKLATYAPEWTRGCKFLASPKT